VVRLARTLADLQSLGAIGPAQVAEAIQFRRALMGGRQETVEAR
jgi:predicted ATPase with chaperone activity